MPDTKTVDPSLIAEIVQRYVEHHTVAPTELPNLIEVVHRSLVELGQPAAASAALKPAVAIHRSYGRDFVICLECGWRGQMLRRHLTVAHSLSVKDYRTRWSLKDTHPLTAPSYTKRRSILAKQLGLGHRRQPTVVPESAAPPPPAKPEAPDLHPAFIASPAQPKRRGRPRRAAATATTL